MSAQTTCTVCGGPLAHHERVATIDDGTGPVRTIRDHLRTCGGPCGRAYRVDRPSDDDPFSVVPDDAPASLDDVRRVLKIKHGGKPVP